MKDLNKKLEEVFTIDGKGRPDKAKLLLDLIEVYGLTYVLREIQTIGERKFI